MNKRIALIAGDGIGPEVLDATVRVLNVLMPNAFDYQEITAGYTYFQESGETISDSDLSRVKECDAVLYAANTNPAHESDYQSLTLLLRKELGLFANIRPAYSLPNISKYKDVDLVIIRENSEGLYIKDEDYFENESGTYGVAKRKISYSASRRIVEFACNHALRTGKSRVTVVHKANVLKKTCGLFRKAAFDVAENFPDLQIDEQFVDAMAMNLVLRPEEFEIIVTTNLFGDILSDQASALVGGLGIAPGANRGESREALSPPVFEPVHGSAPDIAGKDMANPVGMLLSAQMMLEYLEYNTEAKILSDSIHYCLSNGATTRDLGGTLGTDGFTTALMERITTNRDTIA